MNTQNRSRSTVKHQLHKIRRFQGSIQSLTPVPTLEASWFQASIDQGIDTMKVQFQVKLVGSQCAKLLRSTKSTMVPDLKDLTVPGFRSPRIFGFSFCTDVRFSGCQARFQCWRGSKIPAFPGSKVAIVTGCASKVAVLQESKVAGFHGFKAPRFQSSGIEGF